MEGIGTTLRRLALAPLAVALVFAAAGGAVAAGKNGTLGVSMPTIQGPWYTALLYGVTDEAKKLGYDTVILDAGGYANVDKQVTHISNLTVQKVKAILMDPANPAAFNSVVKQAQRAGIPVIGVAIGVAFVSILSNGLNLLNVSSYTQMMVIGAALIMAVALDQLLGKRGEGS